MLLVSKNGKQYAVTRKGDVMVLLCREDGPRPTIQFVLGEGRAWTWLSFEEFCDLVVEVRHEVSRQNLLPQDIQVEFNSADRTVLHRMDVSDLLTCIK